MNYVDIQQPINRLERPELYFESGIGSYDSKPPADYYVPVNAKDIWFHEGYLAFSFADSARQEFDLLARTWRRETGHYSLVQQKILHPAYLQIIGMGKNALPFLVKEIQQGSNHWFPALRAIAGSDRPSHE